MRVVVAAIVLSVFSLSARAEFNWYIDTAIGFGGDTIAEVQVETIDGDIEDSKVKAGEGLSFAFGGRVDIGGNFDLLFSLGYKFGGVIASDGEATFDRMPLSATVLYDFGPIAAGVGLTQELNGEVDLSDAGGPTVDIDDATGTVFSLLWPVGDNVLVGGKYTLIDYEVDGTGFEFNGDHLALYAGFSF